MEAVGQLTGGIAHDFNNLLAAVGGSLELAQARLRQGRVDEAERYISAAAGATNRAASLTHRLLAFSRRQTLDPILTDTARLVDGMEELLRRTVGPSIALEVKAQRDLWKTLVDQNQLENALLNLCINARDAMPEGGTLMIETSNITIDEAAALANDMKPGDYVALSVQDTGTGMTEEVIEKAFDPFFTTKPLGAGTGLGLSMVHGFANQSGGQVKIATQVDIGTTITLCLPRHHGSSLEPSGEAPDSAPAPVQTGGRKTVLVVDDEVLLRMVITDALEELDYRILEAGVGAAALKLLQSEPDIDLLITDIGLPGGMDGRQLATAARTVRPDLKIMFVTGYTQDATLTAGGTGARIEVMTKPFAIEELVERVRSLTE
jgi:CheY-like chemotaxis protein